MAKVKQQVVIKKYALSNGAKYKIKYNYSQQLININGAITTKYSFSKLISSITGKKYSYN